MKRLALVLCFVSLAWIAQAHPGVGGCIARDTGAISYTAGCVPTVEDVACTGSCIGDAEADNTITIDHSSTGTLTLDQTLGATTEGQVAWDATNHEIEVGNGSGGVVTFTSAAASEVHTISSRAVSTASAISAWTTNDTALLGDGIGTGITVNHKIRSAYGIFDQQVRIERLRCALEVTVAWAATDSISFCVAELTGSAQTCVGGSVTFTEGAFANGEVIEATINTLTTATSDYGLSFARSASVDGGDASERFVPVCAIDYTVP